MNGDGTYDRTLANATLTLTWPELMVLGIEDGPSARNVTLQVSDGTNTSQSTTTLSVSNVAPMLVLDPVVAISEDGVASLTGTITDPGILDTFTLDINWGDPLSPNNIEQYTFGASATGKQTLTLNHRYLDDNPTGTRADSYTISLLIKDDDTGSGIADTLVAVTNVAPVVESLSATSAAENGEVHLTGSYSDVGTQDTHRIRIERHGAGSEAESMRAVDQEAHEVLVAEMDAVEVADRQRAASVRPERSQLFARELTHAR